MPDLQSDNVDSKAQPEPLLAAESLPAEENTSETEVLDATDSGTCDLEKTSSNSEMFKRKSQGADSVSKGPRSRQTAASRRADGPPATGNESKSLSAAPVTKTKKIPAKNIEVKTPSDAASPRPPDHNDGGPSGATSPKSKIPVRSTSGAEVKSPVAADKTVTDASGSVVTLKSKKTPETKDVLKPVNGQRAEKSRENGEASPTKTATKTGTKHIKEKSDVGSHAVTLVNGLVDEVTVKATHPPVTKEAQKNPDSGNASSAPSSRLPVSVQARKKNQDATEAGQSDSGAASETRQSEAAPRQSADQGGSSLGETKTTDTSLTLPQSPEKGKTST